MAVFRLGSSRPANGQVARDAWSHRIERRDPEVAIELSVVVPTRHEASNVGPLVRRVRHALAGVRHEVLFVDDSDDETTSVIDALVRSASHAEGELALLHRPPGERVGGLGGAVVEGFRYARGRYVCVIDGDLQHPPELVPTLLEAARREPGAIVIASRHLPGADPSGLPPTRTLLSHVAAGAAKVTFPGRLRDVTDPMSGFFLVEREAVDPDVLHPIGFKILLEVLVRTPALRVVEVPYRFGARFAGESKVSSREGMGYLRQLAAARFGRVPASAPRRPASHLYDVHGIVTVRSDARLPELEPFRVPCLPGPPTISVRLGALPKEAAGWGPRTPEPRRLRYREAVGNLGFAAEIRFDEQIEIHATPLVGRSPHVLYTNLVEAVLRWAFVQRGYALAHGACIVHEGLAFLVTARTDTGKTTTMLKLLDAHPYGFVSDDLTLIAPDGRVLPYPKPLTISKHTLEAVRRPRLTRRERVTLPLQSRVHSRSGRRFAFLLTRTGIPVATVNTVVQLLIPPPKYPVQRLVPGVAVAPHARLAGMFVIQRAEPTVEWLDAEEALEILLGNCEDAYGFPPYEKVERFLLEAAGTDLRAAERQILSSGLNAVPSVRLASERLDWAERIPGLITDIVASDATRFAGAIPARPGDEVIGEVVEATEPARP